MIPRSYALSGSLDLLVFMGLSEGLKWVGFNWIRRSILWYLSLCWTCLCGSTGSILLCVFLSVCIDAGRFCKFVLFRHIILLFFRR